MRTVLISVGLLGLLCVTSICWSGDAPTGTPAPEYVRLRAELHRLEELYGSNHPKVVAVKARLAQADGPALKGPVLVHTRTGSTTVSLADIRTRSLGGRQFLVGSEVKTGYTKGTFVGRQVWIPVDDVTQMVELGDRKPEKE
jgi:hypothetical protein